MESTLRTVVTFRSSAFNTSQPQANFINPGCYGEDLAKWLMERLQKKGYSTGNVPEQEDFGWYFTFQVDGMEHCLVIGFRPGTDTTDGVWIASLERQRGFVSSVMGNRNRGIQPEATKAIHEALSESPQICEVCWHFRKAFDAAGEELGTPTPS